LSGRGVLPPGRVRRVALHLFYIGVACAQYTIIDRASTPH
jgi:hypothetical protein